VTLQSACPVGIIRDDDWTPFRVGRELDVSEAFELCRILAAAQGSQRAWRVVDPTGRQLLMIDGGQR
jgi:hypothetical protein